MDVDQIADGDILLPAIPLNEADRQRVLERLRPEPGWTTLGSWEGGGPGPHLFVPAIPDDRYAVRCYKTPGQGGVVAKVWFGRGSQGPPGHVHGGAQAAAVDHALGAAVWEAGFPSFTASLTYNYRQSVPLGTVATIETWIDRVDGRKIYVSGRLVGREGRSLFGEASALFLRMSISQLPFAVAEPGGIDSVAVAAASTSVGET